jgi:hypothetical protein
MYKCKQGDAKINLPESRSIAQSSDSIDSRGDLNFENINPSNETKDQLFRSNAFLQDLSRLRSIKKHVE